jgi:hypothetical protein
LKHHQRVIELLVQLEKEAAAAKKKDGDLYQRKNKLIPKFQEMKKLLHSAIESLHLQHQLHPQSSSSEGVVSPCNSKEDSSEFSSDIDSDRHYVISPVLSLSEEESIAGSDTSSDSEEFSDEYDSNT